MVEQEPHEKIRQMSTLLEISATLDQSASRKLIEYSLARGISPMEAGLEMLFLGLELLPAVQNGDVRVQVVDLTKRKIEVLGIPPRGKVLYEQKTKRLGRVPKGRIVKFKRR